MKKLNNQQIAIGYGMIIISGISLFVGYLLIPQFTTANISVWSYLGFSLVMFLVSILLLRYLMSLSMVLILLILLTLSDFMRGKPPSIATFTSVLFAICSLAAAGLLKILGSLSEKTAKKRKKLPRTKSMKSVRKERRKREL